MQALFRQADFAYKCDEAQAMYDGKPEGSARYSSSAKFSTTSFQRLWTIEYAFLDYSSQRCTRESVISYSCRRSTQFSRRTAIAFNGRNGPWCLAHAANLTVRIFCVDIVN